MAQKKVFKAFFISWKLGLQESISAISVTYVSGTCGKLYCYSQAVITLFSCH